MHAGKGGCSTPYIFEQNPWNTEAILLGLPQKPEHMVHLARELQKHSMSTEQNELVQGLVCQLMVARQARKSAIQLQVASVSACSISNR